MRQDLAIAIVLPAVNTLRRMATREAQPRQLAGCVPVAMHPLHGLQPGVCTGPGGSPIQPVHGLRVHGQYRFHGAPR